MTQETQSALVLRENPMGDRQDMCMIFHGDVGMGDHLCILGSMWKGNRRNMAVVVPHLQVRHDPGSKIVDLASLPGHDRQAVGDPQGTPLPG